MSSSLDFVFSNLISGGYDGSSIAFIPNTQKLLFPEGNRVKILDVLRGESETHTLEHPATITKVAASKCGKYICTVDRKNWVFVSELKPNGFCYKKHFRKQITAICWGPEQIGFALASSSKLTLYRHPTVVSALRPFVSDKAVGGHYDLITAIEFSNDGRFFSTCSADMTIRIFMTDPAEGFVPIVLSGHRGKPLLCAFGNDSTSLTSLGCDGSVFAWKIEDDFSVSVVSRRRLDEESFESPKNRFQNVTCAAFDGGSLVAGFADGKFKTYAVADSRSMLKATASVTFSTERVNVIAIDGKYAAMTSNRIGELVVWDLESGTPTYRTMSHFGGVSCFAYSPNGVVVATGGDDGKLKVWDTQHGSCLLTFDAHKAPVSDVVFGESGRTVITASFDGTCKAFDVIGKRLFRTFTGSEHVEFSRLAIDPNCEFVAACGRGRTEIYLWAVSTGKLVEVLTGHLAPVSCVDFMSDLHIVSGSWDGSVRIWDFLDAHSSTGIEVGGEVTDLSVSPDDKTVCIATSSGRLFAYDPRTEDYLGEVECSSDLKGGKRLEGERSSDNSQWYCDTIDFSPDGEYVVCGGRSRFVCVYSVKSRLLMRRIVHTVNTDFSGVEGYVKEYHGSGVAQALLDAQLGQREVIEAAAHRVRWCPTGRGLSIASPEGLLVYISADERIVDPLELEVEVTPQAVNDCASKGEWVNAIVMAIRLGHSERQLLLSVLTQVPTDTIEFVCNHIPPKYAVDFLQTLSESLRSFLQIELLFMWITAMLRFHTESLLKNPAAVPVMHLFLKSLSSRIEEIRQLSRSNLDMMRFLCDQPDLEETKTAEND